MEADFQREYGLNLTMELGRLSWRRFVVLVRGLGPNSATAMKLMARRYSRGFSKHDTSNVPIIRGERNVAAYFGVKLPPPPGAPDKAS